MSNDDSTMRARISYLAKAKIDASYMRDELWPNSKTCNNKKTKEGFCYI